MPNQSRIPVAPNTTIPHRLRSGRRRERGPRVIRLGREGSTATLTIYPEADELIMGRRLRPPGGPLSSHPPLESAVPPPEYEAMQLGPSQTEAAGESPTAARQHSLQIAPALGVRFVGGTAPRKDCTKHSATPVPPVSSATVRKRKSLVNLFRPGSDNTHAQQPESKPGARRAIRSASSTLAQRLKSSASLSKVNLASNSSSDAALTSTMRPGSRGRIAAAGGRLIRRLTSTVSLSKMNPAESTFAATGSISAFNSGSANMNGKGKGNVVGSGGDMISEHEEEKTNQTGGNVKDDGEEWVIPNGMEGLSVKGNDKVKDAHANVGNEGIKKMDQIEEGKGKGKGQDMPAATRSDCDKTRKPGSLSGAATASDSSIDLPAILNNLTVLLNLSGTAALRMEDWLLAEDVSKLIETAVAGDAAARAAKIQAERLQQACDMQFLKLATMFRAIGDQLGDDIGCQLKAWADRVDPSGRGTET